MESSMTRCVVSSRSWTDTVGLRCRRLTSLKTRFRVIVKSQS